MWSPNSFCSPLLAATIITPRAWPTHSVTVSVSLKIHWAVLIHRPYHTKVHGPSQMSSHVVWNSQFQTTPLMPSTFNLIVVRLWYIKNWYITWSKTIFFFHNCLKNSDWTMDTTYYINPTLFLHRLPSTSLVIIIKKKL